MKKFLPFLLLLLSIERINAQVAKKIIVEHFTNTKCGICASRNPGLNSNLDANPQVQRISIHPSAPYSNCFLSQQNTSDNDARANYYTVYGSTPKLVINGTLIPTSQNYADAAMFSPFVATSNFTVQIKQFAVGSDSIQSVITIKRVASGVPTGTARLFAALVEDTVFGNGGNGENLHFNVMRRSLYSTAGEPIALPANVGDSLILSKTENFNPIWNSNRMRTVAILQDEVTKQAIQSELSSTVQIGATTTFTEQNNMGTVSIFPNPTNYFATFNLPSNESFYLILYDQLGNLVKQNPSISNQQRIEVSDLADGIYFLKIYNKCSIYNGKIVVNH